MVSGAYIQNVVSYIRAKALSKYSEKKVRNWKLLLAVKCWVCTRLRESLLPGRTKGWERRVKRKTRQAFCKLHIRKICVCMYAYAGALHWETSKGVYTWWRFTFREALNLSPFRTRLEATFQCPRGSIMAHYVNHTVRILDRRARDCNY